MARSKSRNIDSIQIRKIKMRVTLLNSILLTENRARTLVVVLALAVLLGGAGHAQAVLISIKLTTDALGLGSSDINKGGTVDPDMPGFITSPTTGEGSFLYIQTDGKAGTGTTANPLWVTVTAQTRLDVTGLPTTAHDYQAGVIYISKESSDLLDGANEGLGVRAFTVDTSFMRVETSGLANIEGSKEISGGTDDRDVTTDPLNGAPHEDESVTFLFNPLFNVDATSVEVLLSKFDSADKDIFDLKIDLTLGSPITEKSMSTTHDAVADWDSADKLWKLSFSDIPGLNSGDWVESFTIRADLNSELKKTHFLITGMTAVPEPATICLLGLGTLTLVIRRRTLP